ncbi:ASCH domain-containing protein [Halorubrum sp. ASP1]|uniref:ASCH domain-containing protein n=1 Tax=Halorubrum sp. ASP1 TaxID=2518114 RepID=UPI0010F751CD|nr:ASCH domain-containing protein [Halorubrum sp. ASP1]TKX60607.1 ASCH domain-containing protein [Halorubrum sp. ASP1]
MLFKEYHIPMIRTGSKTVTRREWDENYHGPNVGTVVAAKTDLLKPDEKCDCFIRITEKREEYLGEITEASARREGDYDGVEDFRDGYEEVYGEGSWDDDKQVNVIEFEYVGKTRPEDDGSEQTHLVGDGGQTEDTNGADRVTHTIEDPVEVDNFDCEHSGHDWEPMSVGDDRNTDPMTASHMECLNCGKTREVRDGDLYGYVGAYQPPKGVSIRDD